jgi:hypothetical protein
MLYTFTDHQLNHATTVFYRIKAIGQDGKIEYSKTKMVTLNRQKAEELQITPNPTTGKVYITVKLERKETIQLVVRNLHGQPLAIENYSFPAGLSRIEIPSSATLSAGIYMIEVRTSERLLGTTRLIKQ